MKKGSTIKDIIAIITVWLIALALVYLVIIKLKILAH
jgi:hypothetical protein